MDSLYLSSQNAVSLAKVTIGLGVAAILGWKAITNPSGTINAIDHFATQHFTQGVKFLDQQAPFITNMARKTATLVNDRVPWVQVPIAAGVAAGITPHAIKLGASSLTAILDTFNIKPRDLIEKEKLDLIGLAFFLIGASYLTRAICRRFLTIELTKVQTLQWGTLSVGTLIAYSHFSKKIAKYIKSQGEAL